MGEAVIKKEGRAIPVNLCCSYGGGESEFAPASTVLRGLGFSTTPPKREPHPTLPVSPRSLATRQLSFCVEQSAFCTVASSACRVDTTHILRFQKCGAGHPGILFPGPAGRKVPPCCLPLKGSRFSDSSGTVRCPRPRHHTVQPPLRPDSFPISPSRQT